MARTAKYEYDVEVRVESRFTLKGVLAANEGAAKAAARRRIESWIRAEWDATVLENAEAKEFRVLPEKEEQD